MCLRYSFNMVEEAAAIETAIARVLEGGLRTGDIMADGCKEVGTGGMGDAILAELAQAG